MFQPTIYRTLSVILASLTVFNARMVQLVLHVKVVTTSTMVLKLVWLFLVAQMFALFVLIIYVRLVNLDTIYHQVRVLAVRRGVKLAIIHLLVRHAALYFHILPRTLTASHQPTATVRALLATKRVDIRFVAHALVDST